MVELPLDQLSETLKKNTKIMFIQVHLLKGWKEPLWYSLPIALQDNVQEGTVVCVPLRNKTVFGTVSRVSRARPSGIPFEIKECISIQSLPTDSKYQLFIAKISNFFFTSPRSFYERLTSFLASENEEPEPDIAPNSNLDTTNLMTLTDEQQKAVNEIAPSINEPKAFTAVLHGVTGSGKTEVYLALIDQAIKTKKSVIFMLPETSLCRQFESIIQKRLGANTQVCGFHSATKESDKKRLWNMLCQKTPVVIIGVHIPILLPIGNLGLIIIDEEHAHGFQEKKHPKINSKELALWRAQDYGIPIILGSATPSIQTLYLAEQKKWPILTLTQRFGGAQPTVRIASLKKKEKRSNFWITRELESALRDRIARKEQSIIFINRRGHSFFVQCAQCSMSFSCPQCSVSLTFHITADNQEFLECHYCSHRQSLPHECPGCSAPESTFIKKGVGTQQMVTLIQKMLPEARIERADMDATKQKKKWKQIVSDFEAGNIDILVGTQTIAKGYHFPNVTLVGVIWADMMLNMPSFNAAEIALQNLIQVAGRAGRAEKPGTVIIQTLEDHPLYSFIDEYKYRDFYNYELAARTSSNYPPICRLVQIELVNDDVETIDREALEITEHFLNLSEEKGLKALVLGPSKPHLYRHKNVEIRHIFIKAPSFKEVFALLQSLKTKKFTSSLYVIPTP